MVLYRERLGAPWWVWAVSGIGPLMLGVAYGYATSALVGWLVAIAVAGLTGALLTRTAPVIKVTTAGIHARRAFLEAEYIGRATALDPAAARKLRGVAADSRAYLVLRGWLPDAVRLEVDDDRDPTPYWYLSTKDPAALVAALEQCRRPRAHQATDVEGSNPGADGV